MDDPAAVLVLTTWPADRDAAPLGVLVEERLAACVNVLPEMESTYRWHGGVERERERQVIVKTSEPRLEALTARLLAVHPYEVPELLVLRVDTAAAAYLAWLRASTESVTGPAQS